ncbi:CoA pyrophosphatase [Flavobacterium sp. K77]|uniref:NUDIX hydrolase n=1 Tax=Flavobacterium sp. K77 TaxID=2910676 RepID=UPI001F4843BA|nr:CoA pyrophosphatase [Flavobacterium sp. K77]MCF6141630.1 CoA pyrophosphatase [Flavobacterium sp. K77]
MDFQYLLQFVPQLAQAELPAFDAHIKMAPVERIPSLTEWSSQQINPKQAAVMMLLYPKDGITHLVLILRNSYNGVHSSQIAFPGGKFELDDPDFAFTALRETEEEIGVVMDYIEIVKPFTSLYIPPSNFLVHPFLGISKQELVFAPQASEVAGIIELPLQVFLDDAIVVTTNLDTSSVKNSTVPAFNVEGHMVWGATAMMLSELKEVLIKYIK